MADIKNKNELKRRIELFQDELDYSINKEFCMETMKMMREFIGHTNHQLDCRNSKITKLERELKAYREAEEQGLLLRLPCKVGDTIYLVDFEENDYDEATIESIEIGKEGFFINSDYEIGTDLNAEYVFLTKEEAEQKLAEMKGEADGV